MNSPRSTFPFVALLAVALLGPNPVSAQTEPSMIELDPEFTLYIDVPDGRIVVELTQDFAPEHVEQVKLLAREGHYDGYQFARVIEGFLAQAGEPTWQKEIRTGREALPAEFEADWSEELDYTPVAGPDEYGEEAGLVNGFPVRLDREAGKIWITRCPGIFGFARGGAPDTGRASFWVTLATNRFNDRNDTAFGRVVYGMEHASRLPRTGGFDFDAATPVLSVQVAADVPEGERLRLQRVDTNGPAFMELMERRRGGSPDWHVNRPLHYELCELVSGAAPVPADEAGG